MSSTSEFEFAPDAASQSGGIDLISMSLRYKWWLLLGGITGLALGLLAYLKLGPMYEASTQVSVEQPTTVRIRDVDQVVRESRSEHVSLIMSEAIVARAVENRNLDELGSLRMLDDPIDSIVSKLTAKRSSGKNTSYLNILDITYMNKNEDDAKTVVFAVVEAYRQYLLESSAEQGDAALIGARNAMDEYDAEIKTLRQEYDAFREAAPIQWRSPPGANRLPNEVADIYQQRVAAIETDRQRTMLQQADVRSRLDAVQNVMREGGDPEELNLMVSQLMALQGSAAVQLPQDLTAAATTPEGRSPADLDAQLLPLLIQEQTLTNDYGVDYPALQGVRASIRKVLEFYRRRGIEPPTEAQPFLNRQNPTPAPRRRQIDVPKMYSRALQKQLIALASRLEVLDGMYQAAATSAKDYAQYHVQDLKYNDELLRKQALHQTAKSKYDELKILKGSDTYRMRQIKRIQAELSTKRIIKFLGAGGFVGALFALALVYLKELRDTSLRTVESLRETLRFPVLGAVPRFEPATDTVATSLALRSLDPTLVYLHRPDSPAAEAYRAVRTSLFAAAATSGQQAFQITSSEPGDGKSTFLANLAIAIAQANKRVLLIDADLRRPVMHTLFGMRHEIGTSDVIQGDIELLNAVQSTPVTNLDLLSSGGMPPNPAELLSTPDFPKLIADAKENYDLVLIDSPPLLVVSDPCIIAPHADRMLLVVRLYKNKRAAVLRAQELIETHGLNVLGVVANALPLEEEEQYYEPNEYRRTPAPAEPVAV